MALQVKRLILPLATAAGLLALGAPVAAQASTHASRPTIVSVKPATGVSNVASNGNGKLWTITLSNGAVCDWEIGDHAMANYTASGEADIKCPYSYTYKEQVELDYAYAPNGTNHLGRTNSYNFSGAGGRYWDAWNTPGVCWSGSEPTLYWTTFAWISFGGSGTYEATSQLDKKFEPAQC
jgi:hypothetical protein